MRSILLLLSEIYSRNLLFSQLKGFPPPSINQVLQSFKSPAWWSYFFRAKITPCSKLKPNTVFQVYPNKCWPEWNNHILSSAHYVVVHGSQKTACLYNYKSILQIYDKFYLPQDSKVLPPKMHLSKADPCLFSSCFCHTHQDFELTTW